LNSNRLPECEMAIADENLNEI